MATSVHGQRLREYNTKRAVLLSKIAENLLINLNARAPRPLFPPAQMNGASHKKTPRQMLAERLFLQAFFRRVLKRLEKFLRILAFGKRLRVLQRLRQDRFGFSILSGKLERIRMVIGNFRIARCKTIGKLQE